MVLGSDRDRCEFGSYYRNDICLWFLASQVMINPQYYKRAYVLGGMVVAVALLFVGRLFYLQVI